ncbi:methyltransferase domain-containing protein [Thermosulfurimonas marina]|uniref:Methyltransferase domain-containing protein n=2 Tax=Thermosulfurimonas marina TaxID=2047767 RepID=A0A6H1WV18_9BACT|nr:methyltransferase domain-containing protein [Thermosulfurimonas marina]
MDFNDYHLVLREGEKLLFADDVFALVPPEYQKLLAPVKAELPPFYRGEDLRGKTLLVVAQAAIGDALCMTPALREVKRRFPDLRLWVSVSGRARPVLEGLPYIDELLPMPVPYAKVKKADYLVKCIEMVGKPQFDQLNLVEYFLWKLYLPRAEDETPDVRVDEEPLAELRPVFEEIRRLAPGKKVLLFHYLASSVHRTLPPKLLAEIEKLTAEEYVPVICSLPQEDLTVEVSLDVYGVRAANLSSLMKDVRYLVAAVSLADAVITADTATLHIAAGLKKPTVLVSGPINPEFTSRTYPTVVPARAHYRGETCMAPCGQHATGQPCSEALKKGQYYSPCLESLPPEVIVQALRDAWSLAQGDYQKPSRCPVCEGPGPFSLFEHLNGFPIYECPACGLQFAWPMRSEDYERIYSQRKAGNLLDFGETPYESYLKVEKDPENEIARWEKVPRLKVLQPLFREIPPGKHLDVGCGTGFLLLMTQKFGFEAYGMEASEEAVKIAREHFGLRVAQALTFEELPPEFRGPYRLITALEVLEHVEDPRAFLSGIYELLEKDGILILSCPPFYKFENLSYGYRKYKWWGNDYPPNHLTRWKPWTLYYALRRTGFSEIHLFTEPFIPGTLLEGARPITLNLELPHGGKVTIPTAVSARILIESLRSLYLNAPTLGNFQYALAVKEKNPGLDFRELILRAIRFAGAEIVWGPGD